jgi:protein-S-isoprenylcysteine O-methyltransferase Ste14
VGSVFYVLAHVGYRYCLALLLVIWLAGESALSLRGRREAVREELGNEWVMGVCTLLALFFPFQLAFGSSARLSPAWVYASVGLAVLAAGITLRLLSIKTLGVHFRLTISITVDQGLIRNGLYGHIRHPSYTGALLAFLGLSLAFSSPYALLCPLILAPAVMYRIKREENFLARQFGPEYAEYRRATGALWPSFRAHR